jgi:hypothetical protein
MTTQITEALLKAFEVQLGDSFFITVRQLVDYGFYGSLSSARQALLQGQLPIVRVSKRRILVPRPSLIEFLRQNIKG